MLEMNDEEQPLGPIARLGPRVVAELQLAFCAAQYEHARAQHAEADAAQLRAQLEERDKRTANEIIASYYRQRALYPKLTLAKYLRQIGESHREGYIRKVKSAYDTLHKRGTKG